VDERHFKFIKFGHFDAWTFFVFNIKGNSERMDFRIVTSWDRKWR